MILFNRLSLSMCRKSSKEMTIWLVIPNFFYSVVIRGYQLYPLSEYSTFYWYFIVQSNPFTKRYCWRKMVRFHFISIISVNSKEVTAQERLFTLLTT